MSLFRYLTHSYSLRVCRDRVTAELKLPAWPDLEKKIQSQTYTPLSTPFTFPVKDVTVDLAQVDELVRKTSSTPTQKKV